MVICYTKIERLPYGEINKNDWNFNYVTKNMQDRIVDDINQNGFLGPIYVQKYNQRLKKSNVIIDGEHRYEALIKLKQRMIPVIVLDISEEKAKVLSIRLNLERGEPTPDKLGEILKSLSEDNDTIYLQRETGIPVHELNVLTKIKFDDMKINKDEPKKQSTEKSVTCPKCNNKFTIYK